MEPDPGGGFFHTTSRRWRWSVFFTDHTTWSQDRPKPLTMRFKNDKVKAVALLKYRPTG